MVLFSNLVSSSSLCMRRSRNCSFVLLICIVMLGATGCGKDSDSPSRPFGPIDEAQIGPGGGVIEITDKDHPLYGVKVEIPAGALDQTVTIKIAASPQPPSSPFPNGAELVSPVVSLEPKDLQFQDQVNITIPYSSESVEDPLDAMMLSFDAVGDPTCLLTQEVDSIGQRITAAASHFSSFCVWEYDWKLLLAMAPFDTPFDIETDVLSIDNKVGACAGMCNMALWYYNTKKATYRNLRARRDSLGEIELAQDAHSAIRGTIRMQTSPSGVYHNLFYIEKIVCDLFWGKPAILFLTTTNGHFVIADQLSAKTGGDYAISVYDPNSPNVLREITFDSDSSWTITPPTGYEGTTIDGITSIPANPTAMNTVLHAGTWMTSSVVTGDNYRYPIVSIPYGGTDPGAMKIDPSNPTALRIDFEDGYVVGDIVGQHFIGTTHNLWGARRWVDYETMEGDSIVIRSTEIKPDICNFEIDFDNDRYFQTDITFTGHIPLLDMNVWVSNTSTGTR